MNDLKRTLRDIGSTPSGGAFSGSDQFDLYTGRIDRHVTPPKDLRKSSGYRPSSSHFKGVKPGDFGEFFDFEIMESNDADPLVAWYAHSEAAKLWAWDRFHEDMHRTSDGRGWLLSVREARWVNYYAELDGLGR